MHEILTEITVGSGDIESLDLLMELGEVIKDTSQCGLGQTAADPILTTLKNLPGLYEARLASDDFVPAFSIDEALAEACAITGQKPHGKGSRR